VNETNNKIETKHQNKKEEKNKKQKKEMETFEQRVEKKRLEMKNSESRKSLVTINNNIELQNIERMMSDEDLTTLESKEKSENRKSKKNISVGHSGDQTSDLTTSSLDDEEDWKEFKSLLLKIKISRFFVTDFFKFLMIANTFFVRILF
jgi:hypothetical protein